MLALIDAVLDTVEFVMRDFLTGRKRRRRRLPDPVRVLPRANDMKGS